jgi:hypothetical protein
VPHGVPYWEAALRSNYVSDEKAGPNSMSYGKVA